MANDRPLLPETSVLDELRLGTTLSELGRVTMRPTVRAAGPTQGRLGQLCDMLSLAIEIPVVPHAVETYTDLLAGLHWGEIHFAWLPPIIALRAISRGSAVPIAAPVRAGSAWYWTALFTREDSPIETVEALDGARVAWVDHMSSAGYLVIRAALRAQGVETATAFGAETFLGTHDAVVKAVLDGHADVGATFAHFDDAGRVRSAGWGKTPVRVLKYAGPIPSDVLAVSSHLPPEVAQEIADSLVGEGHGDVKRAAAELLDATGFVSVAREHLKHLEELLAHVEMPVSQG
jgi:phosphate/phosphite/phosphonate ABC transporter binding protein